jgi:hypothetical protein
MEGFCEWDQLVSLPHAMTHHTPLRVFMFETAFHPLAIGAKLINISHSESRGLGVVTVWYRVL